MSARPLRTRLPELALEAAMVIFAVLVALAVDEWREGRQYRELADRARTAVVREMRANLQELDDTRPELESLRGRIRTAVDAMDEGREAELDLTLTMPEFSRAAWQAAQVTQAAPYLDYDWVIRVARVYQSHELEAGVVASLVQTLGGMSTAESERDTIALLGVQIGILLQLHASLAESYRAILAEEDS